ncbi:MAG TPA: quinone-dependent dihydroorotate dehydrogenase [Chitinophagaceae bacterium]|jgi:dihydroorotate dehydrogenase|nr:quinone-dependent dihydroorotate dehydrogenase [Chitinophagaceae bacterium]OPZ15906.1 MAG: Dihydroorotate dehydrogenase (quinone) [Bacteroidetes bacterium ADurb.BinA245]HMW67239.1 quinone-dependent dihydroorotate dehydrogenase [Chitinophagaceae bacterium]HMX77850.1 quinone-dependent dihydroorotate dehydrogenase [Chitinophagaceae bacterium]HNA19395.1 quinone-dependent dihydroorotate dehydrogenase [Chitinophagaceae bacterium]
MYQLLRSLLFLTPPEWAHYFSMNSLKLFCNLGFKGLIKKVYAPKNSAVTSFCNLSFSNKVGLGAGFDKNAKYLNELEAMGFGFVEIGTVTPLPQTGNDKPRLFRLPKDKALINRMGFNNDGVKLIAARLQKWKDRQEKSGANKSQLIIGGNIGKNKTTANEDAWQDYEICFRELHAFVDYFVVNVSSPNTPGLRALQDKASLHKILTHLQHINSEQIKPKPILLKIAPDLNREQVDDVISLSLAINLDGLIVSNTTIERTGLKTDSDIISKMGAGGLSGMPLKNKSTELVKYICTNAKNKIPVIASGGIFTGNDAQEKLAAGASLVQIWTGFIYRGPIIIKDICKTIH